MKIINRRIRKTLINVKLLPLLITVMLLTGCEKAESMQSVSIQNPQNTVLGLKCRWEESSFAPNHITRRYYADLNGESDVCIAESFGFMIDDYATDLDGDGTEELVCNCVYGGDGAHRVFIYRLYGNTVEVGRLPEDDLLPEHDGWGANAVSQRFSPDSGSFTVEYSDESGDIRSISCKYEDFAFIPF